LKGFPLYDEILPLVEGWYATGELAYHVPEHDSSVLGDVDGGGADGGYGRDIERPKDDSLSLSSDEEIYEWPPSVSSNLLLYLI
jgi:hypothetical protein